MDTEKSGFKHMNSHLFQKKSTKNTISNFFSLLDTPGFDVAGRDLLFTRKF